MADGKVVIDVILDDGTVAKGVANIDGKLGGLAGAGKRAAVGIKEIVTSLGLVALASKAIDMVKRSLDGAISRYDTLNNFPRVLEQMGFDAETSQKAIQKLSDGIQGLPTTLDDVASTAQRIAILTGDLDGAVDTTLALNNAFISSGSDANNASRGLEQYVQMLSKGEVDLQSWRTLQETMGVALNDTAKAFGFTGASAQNDLYDALKNGNITFDQFNGKLIELSNGTNGFAERALTASGGIRTAWANMGTAVVRGVTDIISAIDSVLADTPLKSIENVISSIGKAFFSVLNGIAQVIPFVAGLISGRLSGAFQSAGQIVAWFKGFWDSNGQQILAYANTVFSGIWNVVQTVFNGLYAIISNILGSNVVPFIKNQLAILQAFWQENGTQITQAVQNAFQIIVSIIQFLMPIVQFIIETVWTAIKDIISGAINVIMGVIQVFTAIFTGDWSQLWEGIKKILKGAIDLILGWMSLSFLGGIRKIFTNLLKNGVNIVKNMWTSIVNFFRNFGNNVTNIATNLVSRVLTYFRNLFTQGVNIFQQLRTFGASIWNALREAIFGVARNILSGVRTNFNNMLSTVRNLTTNVKTTITNIWNQILSFLRGINLVSIGKDIIRGLINGIGSMASAVVDKVKDIGSSISNGFKSFLGIRSPSRVMAELAKWIPEGIGKGIEQNEKSALKSMRGLADNLTNEAQVGIGTKGRFGAEGLIGGIFSRGIQLTQSIAEKKNTENNYNDSEVKVLLKQLVEKDGNVYLGKEKVGSIMDGEQARRINLLGRRVALD
ncbi:tape measure protein [Bacillus sp. B15-48]|uniref:phage tail protein n=1 Tax=Bacillus sp. B15-48 TaxID=1548601 RepID=UPI00193F8157|nr:tape measure protein [Bacillus sp. B15-48]MBM4762703.1 tape measure protein [Bacillus sp. B15-48]